jgi:carboxyl-terminal processing protease
MRNNLHKTFLAFTTVFVTTNGSAQTEIGVTEEAFDYIQVKRSFARQLWQKETPSAQELDSAIRLLREILVYLDKPETRAIEEVSVPLKSQRADTRYDLARALMRAGRKTEALRILGEAAEEAGTSVYADWLEGAADKVLFADLQSEPEFKNIISRLRLLHSLAKSPALKTLYRPDISVDEKIAGLSFFWSTAKNSFVYFDQIPEFDWDKAYLEYLPKVRRTKSTYEYYRVLQEMCALLKDGHTNIYFPKQLQEDMAARPPLITGLVENKVIIEQVFSPTLERQGFKSGLEIVSIDGLPATEYAEKFVRPFLSSSTRQDLTVRTSSYSLLAGAKSTPIELELKEHTGRVFKRSVARAGYSDLVSAQKPPFEFSVLQDNIGYLALNSFENAQLVKDFVRSFDELSKTDALVIDMRANGGGNSSYGDQILSYLTDKPFETARWSSRELRALSATYGVEIEWFGGNGDIVQPNRKKFYAKPIVLLVGNRTFSAAEDFAMAFDYMKRGLLVGEPTAGSTGQPLSFDLPGGGRDRVCAKRDTYPDGRKFVGIGILPGIYAAPKISDFTSGRDSVLETALQKLKKDQ